MKEIPLTFKSEKQQIIGILHLPKVKKAPLIIMCHGWSGNRLGTWNAFFVKAAREFQKNNFAVLRFDFRGSGDSEGKFENQNITSMLKDLDNVIKQISKISEIDKNKICLIGHSQGGYVSLLKASRDKIIKGLILWQARLSDLKDFWSKTWTEELKRKGYLIADDYKIIESYEKDCAKYNSLKASKKLRIPTCLIYGQMDNVVPPSEGQKFFKIIKSRKEFKILKHLNHDFSGDLSKKEVLKITLKWLNKFLK